MSEFPKDRTDGGERHRVLLGVAGVATLSLAAATGRFLWLTRPGAGLHTSAIDAEPLIFDSPALTPKKRDLLARAALTVLQRTNDDFDSGINHVDLVEATKSSPEDLRQVLNEVLPKQRPNRGTAYIDMQVGPDGEYRYIGTGALREAVTSGQSQELTRAMDALVPNLTNLQH